MTTSRLPPTGTMLVSGYPTKIAFAADPSIALWERTVTPPGIDGGDGIDTTTMHNATWRTMAARSLKTLTNSSMTCGYDPAVYTSILALINVETEVTVEFPDGSTLDFYGFLKNFTPNEHSEGSLPEATVEIVPTNRIPGSTTESAPVFTD